MAQLPTQFRKAAPFLINFNFTDIAQGTGIISFNLFRASVDSTPANDEFLMTTNTEVKPSVQSSTINATSTFDIDFNVEFNKPLTLNGIGYVVLKISVSTSGAAINYAPSVTLYKVRGGVEDTIVSTITGSTLTRSGSGTTYDTSTIKLIIPKTYIAKGDILRLNVGGSVTGAGSADVFMDPTNDSSAHTDGAKSSLFIPIDIDL